ncbi:MAG: relaxase/mobilization nuclease domain-containing protein [Oscillospiraceae bacterium]|nr:relaxase/mobilization nuclease domain-containing protein [Oscillospiraceae bacterium]
MTLTAIVKNIPEAKQTVSAQKRLLDYCVQPHKVEVDEQLCFVSGINCIPELAHDSFISTQKLWKHKSGTPRFYQYVQSFSPDENVKPEIVHEIGCEFAKQFGNREILVATHIDREHLHNHFVICASDIDTGIKYVSGKTHLAELRRESDRICQAHGLTVLPTYDPKKKSTNLGSREYRAAVKGESWKMRLCADIDFCMRYARTKKDFLRLMRGRGYDMRWEDSRKYITYITTVNGEEKRVRDIKLHEEKYRKERMEDEFRIRQELFGTTEGEEYSAGTDHTTTAAGENGADFRSGLRAADDSAGESRTLGGQRMASGAVNSGSAEVDGGIRGEADEHDSRAFADGTEGYQPYDRTERGTGWESERESLRLYLASGAVGERTVVAEADSVRTAFDPLSVVVGAVGILGSGDVVDDESEEERREREARNVGSLIGLAVGFAAGAVINRDDKDDCEEEDMDSSPKLSM